MGMWGWVVIIIAIGLVWGGISIAWRAFSQAPRVRSPEMKALDELYFAGDMSRDEYVRKKAELERRERMEKRGNPPGSPKD